MYAAPSMPLPAQIGAGLYFICDLKSTSAAHQVFSFLEQNINYSAKNLNRSRSQFIFVSKVSESPDRPIQPNQINFTKKLRNFKVSKHQSVQNQRI
jgi:hypothetical protein